MFIKGITEYDKQGSEVQTGMVFGRATKDAEHRRTNSGKDITTVSVKAYGRKDGTAAFLDIKCWGSLASSADGVMKGDPVMAAGRLSSREYNGKTYLDLTADFFLSTAAAQAGNLQALSGRMQESGFAPIAEEDGELPF